MKFSVAQAAQYFGATQGLARTTILSVMERLREKGYLVREKRDGVVHPTFGQQFADDVIRNIPITKTDKSVAAAHNGDRPARRPGETAHKERNGCVPASSTA